MKYLAIVVLTALISSGQEVIDGNPPTQGFSMHVCKPGFAMGGAQVDKNQFLCRKVDEAEQDCFVDYSTQRHGMHACPSGSYMRGYQNDRNELLCCFDRRAGTSELTDTIVDPGTQAHGMHVCAEQSGPTVMVGIQNDKNQFLCETKRPLLPPPPLPIQAHDPALPRSFLAAPRATAQERAAWQFATWHWLAHILQVNAVKGYTPPAVGGPKSDAPQAPQFTVLKQEVIEDTLQLTVQYASPIDGVPEQAFLILPPGHRANDNSKKFPAVIVTHGHDDNCKESLARNWNDPDHAAALYFAKQGAIALAPDTRSFCSYMTREQLTQPLLKLSSQPHHQLTDELPLGTLPGQYILDNIFRVSLLEARGDVDASRIFTAGLSLGSYQAMWTAVMDDRVAGVVAGDLFLDLRCLDSSGMNHACQTIPSISRDYEVSPSDQNKTISQQSMLIDTGDLAALIAPRPLLVVWGTADPFFTGSPDCVHKAIGDAEAVYKAFAVPEKLSVQLVTGMHHEFEDFTAAQFLLGSAAPRRDYGTQSNQMHVCPGGFGMIGIRDSDNEFLCAQIPAGRLSCSIDPLPGKDPLQRMGMHACPSGSFMQGAQVDQNRFTCCRVEGAPIPQESVDNGNQVEGMHACPQSQDHTAAPHFMTGLEAHQNKLLCEQ